MNTHKKNFDDDRSNGYETVAQAFLQVRERSAIGVALISQWARSMPRGATVLDLGCGSGVPVALTLLSAGSVVYGIDASPTLVAAFRQQLPDSSIACETVEESLFFSRRFDAVIAVGLLFLLSEKNQHDLIHKVATVLNSGGRFLFSAPKQACTWQDVMTGRTSCSLGLDVYHKVLNDAGFDVVAHYQDDGQNHFYDMKRR